MQAYAEGMVGGGWLWVSILLGHLTSPIRGTHVQLVRVGEGYSNVDVVPSFAGGTLLVTNRTQRGRDDIAVFGTPRSTKDSESATTSGEPSTGSGVGLSAGSRSQGLRVDESRRSTLDQVSQPVPIAVLSLFEHAYLNEKYGVWGRGQYAKDWYRSLNWDRVQKRSSHAR